MHSQGFAVPEGYPLPDFYDVVSCLKCGFVYADTSGKQEDYDLYYQNFSKYENPYIATGSGITSCDKGRCDDTALEISGLIPNKNSSIIDIGCANGGILGALKYMGYRDLTALDPSPACADYIKKKYNVPRVITGGIFSQGLIDDKSLQGRFDCAILSGVIEHIYNVQKAIKNISNLLKAGGILYLETPDASRYSDYYIVPYYYFDSEHINHFDMHSLRNLLIMDNLDFVSYTEKEIKVSKSSIYPSVSVIGKKRLDAKFSTAESFPDFRVKNSVLGYIKKSKKSEVSIIIKLEPLVKSQNPVIIWGAGNFAMRLLEESNLGKCNIAAFIDNDSKKWGRAIRGVPIYPPNKLEELKDTLIICAALYSDDIFLQARSMGIDNEIVVLK